MAHAVHVDAREIEILAKTGTSVSHQPRSNMNNGVGLPAVEGMLRSGIRVCLGNDGLSNAMWEEWKAAYFGHKLNHMDPRRMPANILEQMAIYNNRDLANLTFGGDSFGRHCRRGSGGSDTLDYQPYTPLHPGNLPWHLIFGIDQSMVTTTIVAGKVLMLNRQLQGIDEAKISAEAMRH